MFQSIARWAVAVITTSVICLTAMFLVVVVVGIIWGALQ